MRRPLVMGNWKMHGTTASVSELLGGLAEADSSLCEVVVCPSFVHLAQAVTTCSSSGVGVGGQDCSHAREGAYTGEVSAWMLADLGCQWVILGHSERRQYHDESDALIAAKLAAALEAGLHPVLCVGETREQREAGDARPVVAGQLRGALDGHAVLPQLTIAYEPVWAIGTGLTASPEQAQDMHAFLRQELAGLAGGTLASQVRLLYGGSVKPDNAAELFAQPDIDGALVGGASLQADDFLQIIQAASQAG